MLYNKAGTPYYKTAMRIKGASGPLLEELDVLATSAPLEFGQGPQLKSQLSSPTLPLPTSEQTAEASTSNVDAPSQPEASGQEGPEAEETSASAAQDEPAAEPQQSAEPQPPADPQPSTSRSSQSLATSHSTTSSSTSPHPIGNLEPPLSFLNLLLSPSVIEDMQPSSDFLLTSAPLPYALTYDLGEQVPPPPAPPTPTPPPTPPPQAEPELVPTISSRPQSTASKSRGRKSKTTDNSQDTEMEREITTAVEKPVDMKEPSKPKRDRKAENERRKEREKLKMLEMSAGFRAPVGLKTRRAAAVEAAFEQEAATGGVAQSQVQAHDHEMNDAEGVGREVMSVEPEVELGGDGEAGPSRTAPTSEAQVEAQVEIDMEGEEADVDIEMTDSRDVAHPSVEPSTHQPSPSAEAEAKDENVASAKQAKGARDRGGTKRKRPSSTPHQAPAILEDVGKRDTFLNFETGWILPEGSRRKGRKPPVIQMPAPGEPATKRAKRSKLLLFDRCSCPDSLRSAYLRSERESCYSHTRERDGYCICRTC